jgi:hypothetical protein
MATPMAFHDIMSMSIINNVGLVFIYFDKLYTTLFRIVFCDVLLCKIIVPEDNSEYHTRRRENLKSHINYFNWQKLLRKARAHIGLFSQ